jgi:prepilin-type processing-associated H-X9-DG protein
MIQFSCECGRQLQAQEEHVGKQVKCPVCGRISSIPQSEAVIVAEEAPMRPERERSDSVRRDFDRRRDRDDDRFRRPVEAESTSGKAVAALILGLLSFPCVVGNVLTGLPAIIFGIVALGDISKSQGRLGGKGLAMAGLITGCLGMLLLFPATLIGLLLPAVQKVREAAARTQEKNNLKQIAISMHNFHDTMNGFPQAAAFRSPEGKPLLSWRVALLPYIEADPLYKQFKLDEPWDSPHNIKLLPMIPKTYLDPGEQPDGSGLTRYQVLVGPGTVFEGPPSKPGAADGLGHLPLFQGPNVPLRGLRLTNIPDGASNTILVATADQRVPWTKPEDLTYDPNGPLPVFSKRYSGGFNIALADGSVRTISPSISEQTLRNAITRADRNLLGPDW